MVCGGGGSEEGEGCLESGDAGAEDDDVGVLSL